MIQCCMEAHNEPGTGWAVITAGKIGNFLAMENGGLLSVGWIVQPICRQGSEEKLRNEPLRPMNVIRLWMPLARAGSRSQASEINTAAKHWR
jgi:hypothetical protein